MQDFISQKVFIKLFCRSQFPHESVNLFFTSVIIMDWVNEYMRKLTLAKRSFKHFL